MSIDYSRFMSRLNRPATEIDCRAAITVFVVLHVSPNGQSSLRHCSFFMISEKFALVDKEISVSCPQRWRCIRKQLCGVQSRHCVLRLPAISPIGRSACRPDCRKPPQRSCRLPENGLRSRRGQVNLIPAPVTGIVTGAGFVSF